MSSKLFISYRRDDSAGHAGRVHDRLEREFGRDLLFMDVDNIPLGADFVKVLAKAVGECDVLLAIIGPGWLDASDENGHRRLEDPNDFVRIEIATALARDIPVVPVVLEGTRVPSSHQLPEQLKKLALRQGLNVRHASFHNDMDKLIRGLRASAAPPTDVVEPGRGIGPVKLQMNERQIVELLGEPQERTTYSEPVTFLRYHNLGLDIALSNGLAASLYAFAGRAGFKRFSGMIEGGLSLDSKYQDVVAQYGRPTRTEKHETTKPPSKRIDYENLGIEFSFSSATNELLYVRVSAARPSG